MPAGMPYFAWIDATETTFGPEHMRWDENIFSFTLQQSEGDPASLTVVVRRPRNVAGDPIGLLGPGRKIWAWFALDCGPGLVKFRGRLVGVPTSIFEELVTLEFVARPIDLVTQKDALAQTLRVLPYYDEVVIDPPRRTDPEVVLEGYSKIWHYDRETLVLTVSDEIDGEDGLVEFDGATDDGKVLYDGLGLTLTSGPLARVDVNAEFTWTQQARGNVDLTRYLIDNWPNEPDYELPGAITSFTLMADSWPKIGVGIGDGWVVAQASADAVYDLKTTSKTEGGSTKIKFGPMYGGNTVTTSWSETTTKLNSPTPRGSIGFIPIVTSDTFTASYGKGDISPISGQPLTALTGYSHQTTEVGAVLPLNHIKPTLTAAYTAHRQCSEVVSFSLYADVQSILTTPEDGEALRIDDVKSVNLSELIDAAMSIGDPRRRSYITTERGNRSIEHLIALARAHLLRRARVVEITFAPRLARMPEITLRKNAFLVEPRVGEASGKIIGYSLALDGSDGRINCEVRIGCPIGRGGAAVVEDGEPTYCSVDYVGADYQQFTGRTVLFGTSVGYQPPSSNPNDDGIDFLSPALTVTDVIQTGLVVENPPAAQRAHLQAVTLPSNPSLWIRAVVAFSPEGSSVADDAQKAVQARADAINNALKEVETKATFKLKSMSRQFSSDYAIQVTDLKIPAGYDLEAV